MAMVATYFEDDKFVKYVIPDKNNQTKYDDADIRCIVCGVPLMPCHGQRHYFRVKPGFEHGAACTHDRYHISTFLEEDPLGEEFLFSDLLKGSTQTEKPKQTSPDESEEEPKHTPKQKPATDSEEPTIAVAKKKKYRSTLSLYKYLYLYQNDPLFSFHGKPVAHWVYAYWTEAYYNRGPMHPLHGEMLVVAKRASRSNRNLVQRLTGRGDFVLEVEGHRIANGTKYTRAILILSFENQKTKKAVGNTIFNEAASSSTEYLVAVDWLISIGNNDTKPPQIYRVPITTPKQVALLPNN